ncbi:MAG: GAF domain-containing protein [Deltaproteobacteria bacterium]|nr:GAF domain-containing protein [Deltaproteobacteria bacterium]
MLVRSSGEKDRRSQFRAREVLDFIPYPMVVLSMDKKVIYLNRAFKEDFGWTLKELRGKEIPYIPDDQKEESKKRTQRLRGERVAYKYYAKRMTKDRRVLDVVIRSAIYSEGDDENIHEILILRDKTQEVRIKNNNETMLRISMALPSYPLLDDLLDYISAEIKGIMNTEGALVMLLDEERDELYFKGAAYDGSGARDRLRKFRVPVKESIAGSVLASGRPVVIPDISEKKDSQTPSGKALEYQNESLIYVPLKGRDKIIGVLSARNRKDGAFDRTDLDLLTMIAGTVSLSIENARFSDELKKAYDEVSSMNRAKDRVINHLSHELKTPVSILLASLQILSKMTANIRLDGMPQLMERVNRNLRRIIDIQGEVDDIMMNQSYKSYKMLSTLLYQCADELETLAHLETGDENLVERLRRRIDEIFGPKDIESLDIYLDEFVAERLKALKPAFSHRKLDILDKIGKAGPVSIPPDIMQKTFDGLVRNAVENCPDNGRIVISVQRKEGGVELIVHDYGVGIVVENQKRIFEGFFSTQETMNYSSKSPFDFNAGGKGADLLRMKIFSERYNFKLEMESTRCRYIPKDSDICPGDITKCGFCDKIEDCYSSGQTIFTLFFPNV